MGNWEWPLILFTVLGQSAVGILFCLWWLEHRREKTLLSNSVQVAGQKMTTSSPASYQSMYKNSVLTAGVLLIVAMLSSLFHLGHPLEAYRAMTHLSTSWLSREILLFVLTFIAWVYLFWLSAKPGSKVKVKGALGLTAGIGSLGIISSALIYTLPRVPAWNNMAPVIFFLLTSIILGALTTAVLGRKTLTAGEISQLLSIVLGGVFVSFLLFILYTSLLKTGLEGAATAQLLMSSPLFWLRAALGWVLPLALLLYGLSKKDKLQPSFILLVFSCGLIGELLGRGLFYFSAIGIHITARF